MVCQDTAQLRWAQICERRIDGSKGLVRRRKDGNIRKGVDRIE